MLMSVSRRVRPLTLMLMIGSAVLLGSAMTWRPAPVRADSSVALAQVGALAQRGEFRAALTQLESSGLAASDPRVASLTAQLQRYQQHLDQQARNRLQARIAALNEMDQALQKDAIEQALVHAVEAHSLADDPASLLAEPGVRTVIARAEQTAGDYEQHDRWLDALSLYRTLNLLFEPKTPYREKIERLSQQVRVLRQYLPNELNRLFREAAQRRGDKQPVDVVVDGADDWHQQLEGISLQMLYEAIANAAENHVDNPGYNRVMIGALNGLGVMLQTRNLEQAFPSLADARQRERLVGSLAVMSQSVQKRQQDLGRFNSRRLLDEVLERNRATVNLPENVIIYELAEGAMAGLDEFSAVIWPYDKSQFDRTTQGMFYGVGIQIEMRDGQLLVVSPVPDTPAQRAGIKPGDIIIRVDGKETAHMTLDGAVREITGPLATNVTLTIERRGRAEPLDFTLTRAEIKIHSVQGWKRADHAGWDFYVDPTDAIGYVRISQFIPQTCDDLDLALEQMRQQRGLRGLILDLRFNPGGLLKQSVDVVDRFVRDGTLVSTVRMDGQITSLFTAHIHRTQPTVPMVVLINQGSASASEIVSGALQDHQKAVIVGTRSFGKGSVQDLIPLMGGRAYLKLTTQYYQLPLGRRIHRLPGAEHWGVEPDVKLTMTDQEVADAIEFRRQADVLVDPADGGDPLPDADEMITQGLDLQLEGAVLLLKSRLLASPPDLAQGAVQINTP